VKKKITYTVFSILLFCISSIASSNSNQLLENRYAEILTKLRCLVCQNQSLADSDADLAQDLREKVRSMLERGKTDEEIYNFMEERYGSFALYEPPFNKKTIFLWIAPSILLLFVLIFLYYRFFRSQE
jgi:cytochrome c-type biogenesis protein CcmH